MTDPDSGVPREPIDVHAAIAVMTEQLAAMAWQRLGLQHDMITGQIVRDLDQAKAAVDAAGALSAILEPSLEEDDRRTIQNLIRDLRMNYIQQSKGETS